MEQLIRDFKKELDCNISKTLEKNESELRKLFLNVEIIEEIINCLEDEKIIILKEIVHDLISSMYSGLQSLYRNAYISLRSAIELAVGYIYFVDHNYDYLLWKKDKYDVKWSVLNNEEVGVLSVKYLSLFSEDEFGELFSLCTDIYRACSQFVHGKYEYMHSVKYQYVKYDENTFNDFKEMFYKLTEVIISLLLIRFQDYNLNINELYKSNIDEILKRMQLINTRDKIKEYWK